MTNEEAINELKSYIPKNNGLNDKDILAFNITINSIQENTKLKAEIDRLKEDYSVLARQYNNVENSSIKYYNEVKQLKAELEKLEKYNSKLCIELTITMDKLYLAEKEIERLRNGK